MRTEATEDGREGRNEERREWRMGGRRIKMDYKKDWDKRKRMKEKG